MFKERDSQTDTLLAAAAAAADDVSLQQRTRRYDALLPGSPTRKMKLISGNEDTACIWTFYATQKLYVSDYTATDT